MSFDNGQSTEGDGYQSGWDTRETIPDYDSSSRKVTVTFMDGFGRWCTMERQDPPVQLPDTSGRGGTAEIGSALVVIVMFLICACLLGSVYFFGINFLVHQVYP
jgi:hypothetical protein